MQHQTTRHQTTGTGARPGQIDGFRFAESGDVVVGAVPVAAMPRLQDMLCSSVGELAYEVRGRPDEAGRPALRVRVSGLVQLTCQRCLGALAHPLRIDAVLVLARSEAEIEAQTVDADGPDRILGSREMEVGTMLEDEVLLAVPFAPHHDECPARDEGAKGASGDSPFADLRGLLNRSGRGRN